ncbi:MAG: acyl-CoA mutase large subunit family protein [Prolixibacteraceae bacterium]|nr:acyl-CoA mutase large subunit family protein [Prolixibacteraceae bacterium]
MTDNNQKLFTEFPPVSTDEWEAKINADLKGLDYERALVWRTYEGFNVRPYYREENLTNLNYLNTQPAEFPYTRGTKLSNDWLIRQDIFVQDFEEANKKALNVLGKGVNSLGFYFDCCTNVTFENLVVLLNNICLEACEIDFVCPCANCNCVEVFTEFAIKSHWDNKLIFASSAVDPIGTYTLKGKFEEGTEEAAFSTLKNLIDKSAELPKFRVIGVNGKFFGNSGSSIVQELAFSLAQGAEYLSRLTDAGLPIDEVAKNIKFNFSISNNYFMEIAKLRAARLLWANIVKAFDPECDCASKMVIHSETGSFNKTIYDPHVNMLRTQTEAMSAVLGGADSVTVQAYDSVIKTPSEFSERIARNQQILLKEESHLDKTVDPGAGSYYIENLTDSIASEAWGLFLQIQDKGGFIAALREGFVQGEIKAMADKRNFNISIRKENLLGTNQFPNFSESVDAELDNSLFKPQDFSEEGSEIETLKPYRGAQAFEELRYKTDVYSKENSRPVAFMLTIGNLTMRKARAQFSCNFFAVAGFKVFDNNGFETIDKGLEAARQAGADIIVLCSSDDEYVNLAPEAAAKLDSEILVIAGNPACKPDLEEKGITNFIHVKSDILGELKNYQKLLKI